MRQIAIREQERSDNDARRVFELLLLKLGLLLGRTARLGSSTSSCAARQLLDVSAESLRGELEPLDHGQVGEQLVG